MGRTFYARGSSENLRDGLSTRVEGLKICGTDRPRVWKLRRMTKQVVHTRGRSGKLQEQHV
jgi:hypothetical protein